MDDSELMRKHKDVLYPIVRVHAEGATGSGTVLYSGLIPGKEDQYETYVLTNNHVIEGAVKIEKRWNSLLKREVQTDLLGEVGIEVFNFEYGSWEAGRTGYQAEIVAYAKEMDLALLRVKSIKKFDYVATLFPRGKEKEGLKMFMPLFAVGCGLGHPPLVTYGLLTGFNDIIDNFPYYLSSAPTIFGNSGGAVFLAETMEFVGVPSRISVSFSGYSSSPITHMSFFIPITSVYKFIDANFYQFIYDPKVTSEQCSKARVERRKRDMKSRVGGGEEDKVVPGPEPYNPPWLGPDENPYDDPFSPYNY